VRVLLDTHVWLWMLTDPDRLGEASELVEDRSNDLLLSAASSWEITIKVSLGRLEVPQPLEEYLPARIRSSQVTPLAIEHGHVLGVGSLPPIHRDPFDRLLVAQARALGIPLLTADVRLEGYPVEVLVVR
jgi:PIN domain nuclease of toxin-antitoxin system